MVKTYATRRMRKKLIKYFEDRTLEDWDRSFVKGCINFQKEYPQLTSRQWDRLMKIQEKYKNTPVDVPE